MAQTRQEAQRRERRRRLVRALATGAAAVGIPAAINLFVSRRAARLPPPSWGTGDRFRWTAGEIRFQRLGEGPAILLLHSLGPGHSAEEWRRVAENLAARFEVFAPDLLGFGRSARPRLNYEPALYVRLVRALLDQVVGRPAAVVGAGLSAAYAVRAAAAEPGRVDKVALIAPSGLERRHRPEMVDSLLFRFLRSPVLGTSAINLMTSRSSIATYLEREVFAPGTIVDTTVADRHYRLSHLAGSRRPLAAWMSGRLHTGVGDLLPHLGCPVWLGWGRHCPAPPVESADLWLHRLPDARLEIFEQSGLLPHAESPEETAERLGAFLASDDGRDAS